MGIQFSDKGWYVEGVVQGSQAERCEALRGIGSRLFLTHIQNQPIAPGGVLADDDAICSMLRTAGRPAQLSFSDTPPAHHPAHAFALQVQVIPS